jgi:hypothetical protein
MGVQIVSERDPADLFDYPRQDSVIGIKIVKCGARSLSDLGLIYCGKAGFGQISRSFSLNSYSYSPQTIGKSASNRLSLATIA